ncbi:STN domain-containing protein [Rhodopseudomonas palustris]|uniref:STN domain-containing protein n=1 Tax=Rhodopseudomonas palustris TaxID=1076 RepID=UPI002ACE534B|nr:STN domain-containing protein [Rhodopseudomonas palustris]WQH00499.1 STN domain-containing protein [Rhodopseudomonas palustris]
MPPDAPVVASWIVRPRRALALVFALSLATGSGQAEESVSFDIPSQPLAKALHAFSAATGIEVLVDARPAAGHRAPDLKGSLPPHEALSILLAGSNLVARDFGRDTVILAAMSPAPTSLMEDQRYFADVQRAVEHALCADERTLPGRYRLALKLWVGPSGEVTRAKRLDTTGDRARDDALDAAISRISVGTSPPPLLAQPIAVIVSPSYTGTITGCPAGVLPRRAANR